MTKEEALNLVKELESLIGDYPGQNQYALDRCKQIQFSFNTDLASNGYLREKMVAVADDMSYWFSERRWKNRASSPERMRHLLLTSIAKLKMAISSIYRSPEDL